MADQGIPVVPTDDDASVAPGMLMHLSDMRGFTLPDPRPDIRGWNVVFPNGRRMGKVEDLIVDTDALEAKYVEVKLDHDLHGTDEDGWLLVPISAARLDDEEEQVLVDRLPEGGVAGAPRQYEGHPVPTREQERAVRDYFGTESRAPSGGGVSDQRRFWGRRGSAEVTPPIEAVVREEVVVDDIRTGPPKVGRRDEPRPRP